MGLVYGLSDVGSWIGVVYGCGLDRQRMKITTIVEKPEGAYEFTADLNALQHTFLLEYAIRDLITKGLMPFNAVPSPVGGSMGVIMNTDDLPKH